MYTPLLRIMHHPDKFFFRFNTYILGILFICYGLWIFFKQFYSIFLVGREIKIQRFRKLVLDTLILLKIHGDLIGENVLYQLEDLNENMWSFRKMVYFFWVTDYRKMFYDPEMFDYLSSYFKVTMSEEGRKYMDILYKYDFQGDFK